MGYTIERELMVPDEFHHRQITPELLSDYGYAANTEQYLLNMATLLIRATNAGPYWRKHYTRVDARQPDFSVRTQAAS
jgi:hypothetical protein